MASEIEPAERIEFEVFSRVCDLHPELVERFIVLGLLETVSDDEGGSGLNDARLRRWAVFVDFARGSG